MALPMLNLSKLFKMLRLVKTLVKPIQLLEDLPRPVLAPLTRNMHQITPSTQEPTNLSMKSMMATSLTPSTTSGA